MNCSAKSIATLALLLATGSACAVAEGDLAKRVIIQDGWLGWQVPMDQRVGTACCFSFHHGKATGGECDLNDRDSNISTGNDGPQPTPSDNLSIYLHVSHGQVDKSRALSASCRMRNADQVRWLDPVASADSIAFLAGSAANAPHDVADAEIAAIAMHADAVATSALAQLSDAAHPQKLREQALFWLAQARGAEGARIVERVATSDSDPEMRAKIVFDLSEVHDFDGYASIHRIALHDTSEHVREQALFWMAQTGDKRAKDDIFTAIANEKSDKVREQAVFAVSQLKEGEAESALIALVRGAYPRKVKEQALFWLGQSGSTQAIDFLDEVLSRSAPKTSVR